jgi:hypothetical protein
MNERTLELYRQAQVPHTAIDPSNNMPYETTTFSAEKFAEMIVKATCNIILHYDNVDEGVAVAKKQLGVEE